MRRGGLILAALAVFLLPPAWAGAGTTSQTLRLLPGVTYTREERPVEGGRLVIHSIVAPKPGGLYRLAPVLSNDLILGRETVSAMQKRLSPAATSVGVNGDLFNFSTGHPSGIYLRDGVLQSRPLGGRSSLGIGLDGLLRIARIDFFGTWQVAGLEGKPLHEFNRPLEGNGVGLFTPAWGPATPPNKGALDVVLTGFPAALPNADLTGIVAEIRPGGETAIPPDGAVVQASGFWADRLRVDVAPGLPLTVRLILRPWWEGVADAIGGGPLILQNGQPVPHAGEEFLSSQLRPRHPRTAVGQLADGRVILVAIDGRMKSSVGVDIPELAAELIRLGAVNAIALDAGGSTTVAFDGKVLNNPSDGQERAIGDALMILYLGAFVPEPRFRLISPNGDGFTDFQELAYKIVRPSTVNVSLIAPDGTVFWHDEGPRDPGTYPLSLAQVDGQPRLVEGRWRWVIAATDAEGNVSGGERRFTVNTTLSSLRLTKRRLRLDPVKGGKMRLRFALTRRASVRVLVEDAEGRKVRGLAARVIDKPGPVEVAWDGFARGKRLVENGRYRLRVVAANGFGKAELFGDVIVERKPKKTFVVEQTFSVVDGS